MIYITKFYFAYRNGSAATNRCPWATDACGVGFISDTRRQPSHDMIRLGLSALQRLTHRGAPAAILALA